VGQPGYCSASIASGVDQNSKIFGLWRSELWHDVLTTNIDRKFQNNVGMGAGLENVNKNTL